MQSIGSGLTVAEIFSGKAPLPAREAVSPEVSQPLPTDQAELSSPQPSASKSKSKKSSKVKSSKHHHSSKPATQNPGQTAQGVGADGLPATPSSFTITPGIFAGINNMPGLTAEQKLAVLQTIINNGAAPSDAATAAAGAAATDAGAAPAAQAPAETGPAKMTPEEEQADYEAATKIYNDIWAARRQNQVDCLKIFQDSMAEINKINSNTYAYVAKKEQENIDTFNGYLGWDGIKK